MRAFNAKLSLNIVIHVLVSSSLLIHTVMANALNNAAMHNTWFVGLGGGASRINLAKSTSVPNGSFAPEPFNQDTFTINTPSTGIAQLNAGYVWIIPRTVFPVVTAFLQYRHYFPTHIQGSIEQYSLPAFENYNYTMSYEADLFTVNGKFGLLQIQQLIPYISAGAGFIINHVNDYTEMAKPNVTPRVSPAYQGNSNTRLAVLLGLGLDFLVNDRMTATLGYDHVFQGNLKSGAGEDTWNTTSLNFGNIKMDTVFINLTTNFV